MTLNDFKSQIMLERKPEMQAYNYVRQNGDNRPRTSTQDTRPWKITPMLRYASESIVWVGRGTQPKNTNNSAILIPVSYTHLTLPTNREV